MMEKYRETNREETLIIIRGLGMISDDTDSDNGETYHSKCSIVYPE